MMSAQRLAAPVRLSALGMYVPERIVTNDDLSHIVQTSDEWIVQRTGIRQRRRVAENEHTSDLCVRAIEDLLAHHPAVDLNEIDFIFVATTTPDYVYPSVAAMIQDRLQMPRSMGALDISAACAGWCSAMNLAAAMIGSGQIRNALIIAGEALTRSVDYEDRSTCVLFGDGAGVALIEYDERCALSGMDSTTDGSAGPSLYRTATRKEMDGKIDPAGLLRQDGRDVYRWVVENIPSAVDRVLQRAQLQLSEIDWFVPHSANMRMIEALCKRMNFPLDRTLTSVERYGNTSAVSIPLALIPAVRDGRVKAGDRVLLMGFGGGLVSAGAVLTWL
ncbi:MAG TPA: ketoacyl-ACP synthase III [Candidatus Baltobacteraceae bacterium]|jgi:3-oxoacyl-[acyl-carrier-protein] synthase-3|nr:ketoacyl-ACP synthase III [Candidatus Baltobacteraceae bacterium]